MAKKTPFRRPAGVSAFPLREDLGEPQKSAPCTPRKDQNAPRGLQGVLRNLLDPARRSLLLKLEKKNKRRCRGVLLNGSHEAIHAAVNLQKPLQPEIPKSLASHGVLLWNCVDVAGLHKAQATLQVAPHELPEAL